jgi:type III pantothenate kinase
MILNLDLGNSRIKWQLSDAGLPAGADHIPPEALESGLRSIPWPMVNQVRLCSVASHELTQAVCVACDSLSKPECTVEQVSFDQLPSWFSLGATSPQQIGQDRVMAMLGAYRAGSTYSVIDAGTAVTIDFVSQGTHQGGLIAPGLSLSRESLIARTAQIGRVEPQLYSATLEPGRTTQNAVEHGVRRALIALAQSALRDAPQSLDRILLTGGDAEWLQGHLQGPVEYQPDLVFEGMARFFASAS